LVSLLRAEDARPFSLAEQRLLCGLVAPIGDTSADPLSRGPLRPPRCPMPPGCSRLTGPACSNRSTTRPRPGSASFRSPGSAATNPTPFPIPTELLTVVSKARAIAAGQETGTARARVLSRTGRWLVIHGFALRETAAEGGRNALVIEPATAAEVAPIIIEAYQLGPREQQVTRAVARGLSTVEIAAQLCLSGHTVRDYLKQVFEKVGVSTRGELVAKIFAERYQQPLTANMKSLSEPEWLSGAGPDRSSPQPPRCSSLLFRPRM